jgi:hypothetical protein
MEQMWRRLQGSRLFKCLTGLVYQYQGMWFSLEKWLGGYLVLQFPAIAVLPIEDGAGKIDLILENVNRITRLPWLRLPAFLSLD